MNRSLHLIYIIGVYPYPTMTFIDREIQFLRRKGVNLQVLAIRSPEDGALLSRVQNRLRCGVIYLLPVAWLKLITSHVHFGLLHPFYYFKTLFYLITRPHPNLKARFKTFLHFGEGVYAAFLLRRRRIDELHAHFVDRAATVALVAGRLLNKPYSLSVHAGPDIFVQPVLLPEKILEARQVATCTGFNKTHLEQLVGKELGQKISCIHHGLDLKAYLSKPSKPVKPPIVLSVGQLKERKGHIFLIEACRELKDRGYDFTCQIVGGGSRYRILKERINNLSLEDDVFLCGALPHEQVIQKYQQATLFVLPCIQASNGNMDGIPNVLLEAMLLNVPVVTSHISGIPELVVDRVNGLLIPPGDVKALTDALARLLDESSFREQLARNAFQTVKEKFDIARNVRMFAATLWPDWISNG